MKNNRIKLVVGVLLLELSSLCWATTIDQRSTDITKNEGEEEVQDQLPTYEEAIKNDYLPSYKEATEKDSRFKKISRSPKRKFERTIGASKRAVHFIKNRLAGSLGSSVKFREEIKKMQRCIVFTEMTRILDNSSPAQICEKILSLGEDSVPMVLAETCKLVSKGSVEQKKKKILEGEAACTYIKKAGKSFRGFGFCKRYCNESQCGERPYVRTQCNFLKNNLGICKTYIEKNCKPGEKAGLFSANVQKAVDYLENLAHKQQFIRDVANPL